MNLPLVAVAQDKCVLCAASKDIADSGSVILVVGSTPPTFEIARTHLCVAVLAGFRREPLTVCAQCKGILERSAAQIARGGS